MDSTDSILADSRQLVSRIMKTLGAHADRSTTFEAEARDLPATSAVLLLLGPQVAPDGRDDICLVLNKRSRQVRQPGDLCCPGGSVSPHIDFRIARLLGWPMLPLGRWPPWRSWRREQPLEARWLALYLATGLREAFEEMRLNPFRIRFLGPLEPQRLILFQRVINPLVTWVPHQRRFRANWEVERIVRIPLRTLLDPRHYVRYRLTMDLSQRAENSQQTREHPAFRFRTTHGTELLWGVTYRITMSFLRDTFGFSPPAMEGLPLELGRVGRSYLTGEGS